MHQKNTIIDYHRLSPYYLIGLTRRRSLRKLIMQRNKMNNKRISIVLIDNFEIDISTRFKGKHILNCLSLYIKKTLQF